MLAKGFYNATINHVWPRNGANGEYWEWAFQIKGEKYPLKAFTSSNLKNEKTRQYLNAVLHYVPDPDDDFYTDSLRGQSCSVQVGTTLAKNGKTYNCIESVV